MTSWGRAEQLDDVSGQVAIVGVGEGDHSKASGRTTTEIALQAVERALEDAGLRPEDVDGLMVSGSFPGQVDDVAFHEHFGTTHDIWTSPDGGGMVWAGTAPHTAAKAIAEGKASVVVNSFAVAWASERSKMVGGPGQSHAQELHKQQLEVPFGWFPQPVYFATIARRHMHEFGTTEEQLGAVAVTLRRHANGHPTAVIRDRPLTMEQYLASPPVTTPFRKEDCSLISDGSGAYVVTSVERARDLAKPVVEVAGVGLGSSNTGVHWAEQGDFTSTPQVFASPGGYGMAGITAADVDVLACYDPFTIVSLMQLEDLGFCAKGEGGPFAASGALAFDGGVIPYNTHGGLLSHAYVLGIAHVVEVVRQLRGEAANQVPDAEVGVYGGYTGPQASTLVLEEGPLIRAEFPLPDLAEPLTGPFWEHAQRSVLALPKKADGSWHWYPKTTEVEWVPVSGRGTVFSWTEVHQVFLPAFADDVPYLTGLVELEEDPSLRLATRFVDCESIAIGDAVEVTFRPMRFPTVDGEVLAPFFRPAS